MNTKKRSFAEVFQQYRAKLEGKDVFNDVAIDTITIKPEPIVVNKNIITKTPANKNDFEKLSFVCKARSNDSTYEFKSVIHVERSKTGCRIIATDGRRLHYCETKFKIASGDNTRTMRVNVNRNQLLPKTAST